MTQPTENDFIMCRLGEIMEPDPSIPDEVEGTLNPGVVRGRDGELYLFPRIVGDGNFSRIGKARVRFDDAGNPTGVDRLGYALEPTPHYERHGTTGGCEDPRITYFKPLDTYFMTYTAWGPSGPRIAVAASQDLEVWHRKGRVDFLANGSDFYSVNFDYYHNKDGLILPEAVTGPDGRPSLALLHRPVYETAHFKHDVPPGIDDPRPSIWISYCALEDLGNHLHGRLPLCHHHCLADPEADWESMRIGGGAPPIRTDAGWLLIYHGVCGQMDPILDLPADCLCDPGLQSGVETKAVCYRAGIMLLDLNDPRKILYRTPLPVLEPTTTLERSGVVANVVFPTGMDVRSDIGQPRRVDVYYGMADSRIGAATFNLPE